MCAFVYSSLLLFFLTTTLTISIMCGPKMATAGLPFGRRERGADPDILAGADFLSVLIESSLRRAYSETTTTTSTTLLDLEDNNIQDSSINYVRSPRETSPFAQTSTEIQSDNFDASDSDSSSVRDGVVVAVSISSSVGRTISKALNEPVRDLVKYTNTLSETLTEPPTTELFDQSLVASEDHPSIILKSSKSELSVEESEPITKNGNLDFSQSYPARVRQLPSPSFNPGFANQKPIHSSLIFHDNPQDPGRARSVSYSTVIQHPHLENEMEQNSQQHERHERNYNGAHSVFVNNYDVNGTEKRKLNNTKLISRQGHTQESEEVITSTPFSSTTRNWETSEDYEEPTRKEIGTTEGNWEIQEKPYSPPTISRVMPKVYAQAEQNYEVEEAVSVVTNGRTHGVQPSLPPDKVEQRSNSSKKDDNQKVGYVVEGRNYRKYRVEERTADGFIVGEYGVVSHDDGSLRGVRYTADGTINPRLIYDALMKFLSL